jgi:predicted nucleic acid-binding protein
LSLIDANALVNLVDQAQPHSEKFRTLFNTLQRPVVTTWPAFTEAMYLVFSIGGWPLERRLWDYILLGLVHFHFPDEAETQRMVELMERYRDRPMDLADASLVAAAETLNDPRILTQDADFYIYRFQDKRTFEVIS